MKKKITKWIGKIATKFAKWQQKHWILSLFSVRLLAVWFSFIVTYAGEALLLIKHYESGKKQFTIFGMVCTVILIAFVTFGEISLRYACEKDQDKHDRGAAFMLRNLRDATSTLCESKYNTLVNEIYKITTQSGSIIPDIISNPEKQLDNIANQMSSCLCKLLQEDKGEKWRQSDIFVSIAYEYPSDESGAWHWATSERGLSLDGLLHHDEQRMSTMLYCLENKGSKVFFNSKQTAFDENRYIPDSEDEYDSDGKLLGSIACFEDTIKKNDIAYVHYVLTISTYDKRFVSIEANDYETPEDADAAYKAAEEAVKYNMYKNIVSDFLMRVKIELCLLYLSQLKDSTAKN